MLTEKGKLQRENILNKAMELLLEVGIDSLSHKLISDELSLSKSAVLYHYPSKKALIEGLVNHYVEHLKIQLQCHEAPYIARGLRPENAVLPGMRSWYYSFSKNRKRWIEIGTALLSLAHEDPSLLEPLRQWYRDLYRTLEASDLDHTRAFNVMMAFDGFFNASKLGIMVMAPDEVERMQIRLLESAFEGRPPEELAIALDEACLLQGDQNA